MNRPAHKEDRKAGKANRPGWLSSFLAFLIVLVGFPASAASTMWMAASNSYTQPITNSWTAYPVLGATANANGSWTIGGPARRITPASNGYLTNTFAEGNHLLTNSAYPGSAIVFRAPSDGTHNIHSNRLSGYNTFVTIVWGTNPPPTRAEITNALEIADLIGGQTVTNTAHAYSNSLYASILAATNSGISAVTATNAAISQAAIATNSLNATLRAVITAATNDLNSTLTTRVTNATNDLNTTLTARISGSTNLSWVSASNAVNVASNVLRTATGNATNDVFGTLSTRVTNATNDLNTVLRVVINDATNSQATVLSNAIRASVFLHGSNGVAQVIRAGGNYTNIYTSVADAIASASAGDKVRIFNGTNYVAGPIGLKERVTVEGEGPNTIIYFTGAGVGFIASNNIVLQDLTLIMTNVLETPIYSHYTTNSSFNRINAAAKYDVFLGTVGPGVYLNSCNVTSAFDTINFAGTNGDVRLRDSVFVANGDLLSPRPAKSRTLVLNGGSADLNVPTALRVTAENCTFLAFNNTNCYGATTFVDSGCFTNVELNLIGCTFKSDGAAIYNGNVDCNLFWPGVGFTHVEGPSGRVNVQGAVILAGTNYGAISNILTGTVYGHAPGLTGDDEAFSSAWNGAAQFPTKNAIYDAVLSLTNTAWLSASNAVNVASNVNRLFALNATNDLNTVLRAVITASTNLSWQSASNAVNVASNANRAFSVTATNTLFEGITNGVTLFAPQLVAYEDKPITFVDGDGDPLGTITDGGTFSLNAHINALVFNGSGAGLTNSPFDIFSAAGKTAVTNATLIAAQNATNGYNVIATNIATTVANRTTNDLPLRGHIASAKTLTNSSDNVAYSSGAASWIVGNGANGNWEANNLHARGTVIGSLAGGTNLPFTALSLVGRTAVSNAAMSVNVGTTNLSWQSASNMTYVASNILWQAKIDSTNALYQEITNQFSARATASGWQTTATTNGGVVSISTSNALSPTLFNIGAMPVYTHDTNIIYMANAGSTAANGTYFISHTNVLYTNTTATCRITNISGSWFVLSNDVPSTVLYSSATYPTNAAWTIVNGVPAQPLSFFGARKNIEGTVIEGPILSTNLQARLNAMILTAVVPAFDNTQFASGASVTNIKTGSRLTNTFLYGPITNGGPGILTGPVLHYTNAVPSLAYGNGSLAIVTNGSAWIRTNDTWVNLFAGTPSGGSSSPTNYILLFSQIASTTVANTDSETTLTNTGVGTISIPANSITAGSRLRFTLSGNHGSVTGGEVSALRVKFGSTVFATVSDQFNANGGSSQYTVVFDVLFRTVGASVTPKVSTSTVTYDNGSSFFTTRLTMANADNALNTTTANTLDVTMEWDSADPANTVTVDILTVELFRP